MVVMQFDLEITQPLRIDLDVFRYLDPFLRIVIEERDQKLPTMLVRYHLQDLVEQEWEYHAFQ